MDCTGKGNIVCLKVCDHLLEHGVAVTLHPEVFLPGNDPFGPTIRCFGIIAALHSGQIQALTEAILPGVETSGEISHGTPDIYEVSAFISLFIDTPPGYSAKSISSVLNSCIIKTGNLPKWHPERSKGAEGYTYRFDCWIARIP